MKSSHVESERSVNEWICEEVPAVTVDGKVISTMLRQEQKLVRCKDCKNAEHLQWLDNVIVCKKHSYTGIRPEEFFCADGEHKEGR